MTTTSQTNKVSEERHRPRSGSLAITGLLLLSILPVAGGVLRLGDLGADPENAPPLTVAIVAHIVAMSAFCLVGAFQFSPALRLRRRWHRAAGRALLPAGFIGAVSSIPLGVFFGGPREEVPLAMVRVVFAVAMTLFLVLAAIATKRRDFATHGAWMTRAYALAIAGGTQAIVSIVWTIFVADVDANSEAWLVATGFVINSVVAGLLIRRRSGRRMREASGRGARVAETAP